MTAVYRFMSKILRVLESAQLLGSTLLVAGTNALWAYEAKVGLQFWADVVATTDADILWDPRATMKILSVEVNTKGILGLLRKVDKSFETECRDRHLAPLSGEPLRRRRPNPTTRATRGSSTRITGTRTTMTRPIRTGPCVSARVGVAPGSRVASQQGSRGTHGSGPPQPPRDRRGHANASDTA